MSECNRCTLNQIKARALREGKAVLTMPSSFMGGTDVFIHPKDVDITKLPGLKTPDHPTRNIYFAAWFMEIPKNCECD